MAHTTSHRNALLEAPPPQTSIADWVQGLWSQARAVGATDVLMAPVQEAGRWCYRVRWCVAGRWVSKVRWGHDLGVRVVRHVKATAGLDVSMARWPQDGALRDPEGADVRVHSCPGLGGERLVCRLMPSVETLLNWQQFPWLNEQRAVVERAFHGGGLWVVAGWMGSGKTSTLYTCARYLIAQGAHVVSLEDPIEMTVPGMMQTTWRPTDRSGHQPWVRAVLRQRPDALCVGEVRDPATMAACMALAATGHLVLTSLHASTLDEVWGRLAALSQGCARGWEAWVQGVVLQRLLPRLCPEARRPARPQDVDVLARRLWGWSHHTSSWQDGAEQATTGAKAWPLVSVWSRAALGPPRKGRTDRLLQHQRDRGLLTALDAQRVGVREAIRCCAPVAGGGGW